MTWFYYNYAKQKVNQRSAPVLPFSAPSHFPSSPFPKANSISNKWEAAFIAKRCWSSRSTLPSNNYATSPTSQCQIVYWRELHSWILEFMHNSFQFWLQPNETEKLPNRKMGDKRTVDFSMQIINDDAIFYSCLHLIYHIYLNEESVISGLLPLSDFILHDREIQRGQ